MIIISDGEIIIGNKKWFGVDKELTDYFKELHNENKALRLLLNWAEECDWGFDNFRDDDVVDWQQFEEESENMGYVESMIYYARKYLEMNELEGKDK